MGSRTFNGNISSYRCLCEGIVSSVMSDSLRPHGSTRILLSMGFSRQEYGSVLPCSPPGDLYNPGIKPASLTSPALAGEFLPLVSPGKTPDLSNVYSTLLQRMTGRNPFLRSPCHWTCLSECTLNCYACIASFIQKNRTFMNQIITNLFRKLSVLNQFYNLFPF